jgi:hypothetical protein
LFASYTIGIVPKRPPYNEGDIEIVGLPRRKWLDGRKNATLTADVNLILST